MWPYTADELKWLSRPLAQTAPERHQRAIDRHWMKAFGIPRQPANDDRGEAPGGAD